uniref:G-2 and S-phase expressed 1 n=1 Tax=Amphiprion percula TaxID=161767 RepID=A0A3P8TYT7_AMPPE
MMPLLRSSIDDVDEDEVFVGPVSHKEKCVSAGVVSRLQDGSDGVRVSWSPLSGDQLEAVCQEATKLANQLQSGESHSEDTDITDTTTEREEFVEDSKAKLGMLGQTASALSPIKRQTFCVQDSPMKELPPAIQRTTSSTRPTTRLSTSSPVVGPKAPSRMSLRGKAALGVAVVLPSKPAAPTTSCSASKSKVEKTRLQPPRKVVGGLRQSPSSRLSSRAESNEDLLSDSASVASDISDSSLNSSLLGKRTLAPPTKVTLVYSKDLHLDYLQVVKCLLLHFEYVPNCALKKVLWNLPVIKSKSGLHSVIHQSDHTWNTLNVCYYSYSLPQKTSAGSLTPSASSSKSLQMKARRPSALPTPVKRRMSAIPAPTPTNQTRTVRPPAISNSGSAPTPTSARKQHTLHPQEKLLIDLTNTPDLVRTSNKTCSTTQLIDLSSPLIKWSPDDKRENALLINLSF